MGKVKEIPVDLSLLREVASAPEHRGLNALAELRRAPLKHWRGVPRSYIERLAAEMLRKGEIQKIGSVVWFKEHESDSVDDRYTPKEEHRQ